MSEFGSEAFRRRAQAEAQRASRQEATRRDELAREAQASAHRAAQEASQQRQNRSEQGRVQALARDVARAAIGHVSFNRRWILNSNGMTAFERLRNRGGIVLDEGWAIAYHLQAATWHDSYDDSSNEERTELVLHTNGVLSAQTAPYGVNQNNFRNNLQEISLGSRSYYSSPRAQFGRFGAEEAERALYEFAGRYNLG